jgi:hypothetical protein
MLIDFVATSVSCGALYVRHPSQYVVFIICNKFMTLNFGHL